MICCHGSEGQNDGLNFQRENLYGTTAEEQNVPVSHSETLSLSGPPQGPSKRKCVLVKVFHHITEKPEHLH